LAYIEEEMRCTDKGFSLKVKELLKLLSHNPRSLFFISSAGQASIRTIGDYRKILFEEQHGNRGNAANVCFTVLVYGLIPVVRDLAEDDLLNFACGSDSIMMVVKGSSPRIQRVEGKVREA